MNCPRCQHTNPPDSAYCDECGARLEAACLACGEANRLGAKFCRKCGQPLGGAAVTATTTAKFASPESYTPKYLAERILTSKTAMEGERKHVTVLFADVKGSMELLADRDPEEARTILDPVLTLMMEAVHRYEGTVNQVMGDGIMALFGAPIAHEDHAVRACYAALRMQEQVRRHAEGVRRSHGVNVQVRIGLNSGEVVVRAIGSDLHMDYTAVGQTTHLAARMEQLADAGSILVAPSTLALVEGFIAMKPLGPVPVKGLTDPVEVFQVTGTGPARNRFEATTRRGLTRFVGRDAELDQLRRAQQRAADGHGQVVALVGEAGVGKSRLVYEFSHSHRLEEWQTVEGAAVSYGTATSYSPVIDLLRGYFKIQDSDDVRVIREKVTGKLLTLDRALEPTLPALLALLEARLDDDMDWRALDPAQRRERTLDAVRRLLLSEARQRPLLVIVEDLHWIDNETQAVLDTLVESLSSARLMLLVNYRPEYEHGWARKSYYSQLRIDTLPTASTEQLLEAILGSGQDLAPLKQLLVRRGNPFFLEETIRTLVETRALVGERGRYRLTEPIQHVRVPATVQTVLAARIDRLPGELKQLLQIAAVIGRDVPLVLLQPVAERADDELRRGLAQLQAAEFLYETRLFPDSEYSFAHALTHDVTYASLLHERRRALHARVVETIEHVHDERLAEYIERLADHAFRGEVWDKALRYGQQMGDKAGDRRAYREAVAGYERALEAIKHLPHHPEGAMLAVELRRASALMMTFHGEYRRSLDMLDEAEGLAQALGDKKPLGSVMSLMSYVRRERGQLDGAVEAGQRGLDIAMTLGDVAQQAEAAYRLAQAHWALGAFTRAAELLRGNIDRLPLTTLTSNPARDLAIFSRAWLARVSSSLGDFAVGARCGEEAVALAMAEGRGEGPIIAHGCLGILLLAQGDFATAIRTLERGLALGRASDNRNWSEIIAGALGEVYGLSGRMAEGLALLEAALEDAVQRGARFFEIAHVRALSSVHRRSGRLDEAAAHARKAIDLARAQGTAWHEASALFELATAFGEEKLSNFDLASTYYQEALALARSHGMRPLVAHCHAGLAKLYRRTGKPPDAEEHITTATTMYREMGMLYWLDELQEPNNR